MGLRHPAPSPDGSRISFSYQGDIWTVPSQGGLAHRLTVHVGYESYPSWSPDGRLIAFSSNRNDNFDVFTISAEGGPETQLTWHSSDDFVSGWSPDSREVLFSSRRDQSFEQVWSVPAMGGKEHPLTQIESYLGSQSNGDERLIFTRGAIPWWRKGYRGSASCDIFSKNLRSGDVEQLTFSNSNDLSGFLVPASAELVYLSDSAGSYNLFRRNLVGGTSVQMTSHRLDVHHPVLSADGSLITYELGGEIFIYDLKTSQGRKLNVTLPTIDKTNDLQVYSADSGITEFLLSPDAEAIAYINGGEVFCQSLYDDDQRRLTSSAAGESDLSWSADSRELVYVGAEETKDAITILSSNDDNRPELFTSHDFVTTALIKSDQLLASPRLSPDRTRIAFVREGRQLVAADMKKLTERTISDNRPVGDFDWSPDGRYIVFTARNGHWDNEVFIGDSESGSMERISDSPAHYRLPKFSRDGKLVYFLKDGDVYYVYLERQLSEMSMSQRRDYMRAYSQMTSSNVSPVAIDFEAIETRSRRLTDLGTAIDVALSHDLEHFVFSTANDELYAMRMDDIRPQLVSTAVSRPTQIQFIGETSQVLLLDDAGRLNSVDISTGEAKLYPIRSEWTTSRRAQYQQVFAEIWQTVKYRFYDPNFHGVDWDAMREIYAPRVESVSELIDFQDLIREMLGELNASHLNIWSRSGAVRETGILGIVPEYGEESDGWKVAKIIPDSPAARRISEIKPFDKITAVDGVKLDARMNCYMPLNGKVDREIRIDIVNRAGLSRMIALPPISPSANRELVLRAREAENQALINDISAEKIGYILLPQITEASVDQLEMRLKQFASERKSILIDLRGNFGGSEHDRLLELLSRKAYVKHQQRFGQSGFDSPWAFSGPIALLVDERTSSDAEIVAEAFRSLGLGEVIGVKTAGAVIGTEKQTMVDGSVLNIPTVGWYSLNGANLENSGVSPDVNIKLNLTLADRGEDNQLIEAAKYLTAKLK